MTQEEFFERIRSTSPNVLAHEYFHATSVHLFPDGVGYQQFKSKIKTRINSIDSIAVVGSGNWRYSLNPEKSFREFGKHSDVDVAVVSSIHFHDLWEEMRHNHRRHYYALSNEDRKWVRRNGENVYSGFISPTWIPRREAKSNYAYKQLLNILSDESVRFFSVKLMFFKNADEALDYYTRGFKIARKALS